MEEIEHYFQTEDLNKYLNLLSFIVTFEKEEVEVSAYKKLFDYILESAECKNEGLYLVKMNLMELSVMTYSYQKYLIVFEELIKQMNPKFTFVEYFKEIQ